MKYEEAVEKVEGYLAIAESKMNTFGSALPDYVNPNIKLQILNDSTEEHDFGWVFYYNSAKFNESGDLQEALGGNAPLIINKISGELIETGTAQDTTYYINNYVRTGDPHREA